MATLIPSLHSQIRQMTGGERRFAERLEEKLEDDCRIWYDVPTGASAAQPDFLLLHPRRGLLVLEVRDWTVGAIERCDPKTFTLSTDDGLVELDNPLEQAMRHAHAIVEALKGDPALVQGEDGRKPGSLRLPWGPGVVLPNITRRQFEAAELGAVLPEHRVVCQDEMYESTDAAAFAERLWAMVPWPMRGSLTREEVDRIRFHLHPEVRIGRRGPSPDDTLPDVLRIMDLQQEQLARSLGEGHRVIHGVAGSGKTMILAYRCVHLAKATQKPVLVLCYNETLAVRLSGLLRENGLEERVTVRTFHAWCYDQLAFHEVALPPAGAVKDGGAAFTEALVERVISAMERDQIPAGQYGAVLIDEAQDFAAHWLKLVVRMVDPETNSLLVLYDDAQSIYGRRKRSRFSLKSVGIQAQGRTTLLKLNYRNTAEVLDLAYQFAEDVLRPSEPDAAPDDEGVPLVLPESTARHGAAPELVKLPCLKDEVDYVAERFRKLHGEGTPWRDMAVLYRTHFMGEAAADRLRKAGVPVTLLSGAHRPPRLELGADTVKALTFQSSKGLEFPVVAIPGVGFLPYGEAELDEEVRLMYVGMTRAMDRLLVTYHRDSAFVQRLAEPRSHA